MNWMNPKPYQVVVDDISQLGWSRLGTDDLRAVALGYYFFSVQFRESLELACAMNPWDNRLQELRDGECDTDNLSPYPGVAAAGERMNHDEFMRRVVVLCEIDDLVTKRVSRLGEAYLSTTRRLPESARALSISSYEDGGLEKVFHAILMAPTWSHPGSMAFQHFLVEHIRFDSDEGAGHGALSRHLVPDQSVVPMWSAFRDLLIGAAPCLLG